MRELKMNDGLQEMMINGDPNRVLRWNPTDTDFGKRYLSLMEYVEGLKGTLDTISAQLDEINQNVDVASERGLLTQVTDALAELGVELSKKIDETFNAPVCDVVFCGANPMSPTVDGGFLFNNFLEAMSPIVASTVEKAGKTVSKKIAQYADAVKKAEMRRSGTKR